VRGYGPLGVMPGPPIKLAVTQPDMLTKKRATLGPHQPIDAVRSARAAWHRVSERWLTAEPPDALVLQRPLADGALRIVAKGEKEDRIVEFALVGPLYRGLHSQMSSQFNEHANLEPGSPRIGTPSASTV
jgi:hypothetical protein